MSEALLWSELKDRKLAGFKFVRQHPIGPFFADFLCRERKLVVEIDGSQHADSQSDRQREEYMSGLGYTTLRFWNIDAVTKRDSVCETILAVLTDRLAGNVESIDFRMISSVKKSDEMR